MKAVHLNLIAGKYLSDFLNLLHCHAEVVSLLEDELSQFDVRKLLVEVLEELVCLFDYLVGQVHQVVPHG